MTARPSKRSETGLPAARGGAASVTRMLVAPGGDEAALNGEAFGRVRERDLDVAVEAVPAKRMDAQRREAPADDVDA